MPSEAGITRRHLQIALGLLWLIDGLLQAQPFMFTRGFATQVIAPAAQGQPGFVAAPVDWASTVIAAHPVAWNAAFAGVQLLVGVGLLVPRTARLALAASIAWALGVWYFGEGLSGLASGNASLITGAPGSALLLAVLAGAAWPSRNARARARRRGCRSPGPCCGWGRPSSRRCPARACGLSAPWWPRST
jgi:hypothetical protein